MPTVTAPACSVATPSGLFQVTKSKLAYRVVMKASAREWVTKTRRDAAQRYNDTPANRYRERSFWKTVEMAMSKLLQSGAIDSVSFWGEVSSQLKKTCSPVGYDDALKQLFRIK